MKLHIARTLKGFAICVSLLTAMQGPAREPDGAPSVMLPGNWRLAAVDGADPASVHIKEYRAQFEKNGSWLYTATMNGNFEGMQLNGHGTWAIKNGVLSWTAGANSGASKVIFKGKNQLLLDSDPVIRAPGGKQLVRTEYVRIEGKRPK
jgi:hypothetical protein